MFNIKIKLQSKIINISLVIKSLMILSLLFIILLTPTVTKAGLIEHNNFLYPTMQTPQLPGPDEQPGIVYIAYTIDTEPRGMDTSVYSQTLDMSDYDSGGLIDQLTQDSFREQYKDSFGKPLVFSWFLLTQQVQCASTQQDCSMVHAAMEPYRDTAQGLGDIYGWHYHHMDWTDINYDGIHYWNQLKTFNGRLYGSGTDIENAEGIVAQLILDKGVYPGAFRTGWTWENTEFSNWLDDITPFDFSSIAPQRTNPGDPPPPPSKIGLNTDEPTFNIFDWYRAPVQWTYYHPLSTDYQTPGDLKRYVFRSSNGPIEWEKAFVEAENGKDQLITIYSHSYNDISLYKSYLENIKEISLNHPKIKFKFVTAEDGARYMISSRNYDIHSPEASISKSGYFVTVTVNEPLFTFPYGALVINGEYLRVRPIQTNPTTTVDGHLSWTFDLAQFLKTENEAQFRIGGIDPSGNWFVTPIVNI